jgi:hypothetical protein
MFEIINLLHNYADMHRALQMPAFSTAVDGSRYIRTLCQLMKRAILDRRGIEIVLSAEPLQLRSEQCWRLGMIVAELIINSSRHAFGDGGGTIRIELSSLGTFAQFRFVDDGTPKHSSTAGQGLKIIDALALALNGEIVHRSESDGTTSILIFPIGDDIPQIVNSPTIIGGDLIAASANPAAEPSCVTHEVTAPPIAIDQHPSTDVRGCASLPIYSQELSTSAPSSEISNAKSEFGILVIARSQDNLGPSISSENDQ